ncbi:MULTISPECIES: DUF937 domain-containing protein [Sphingosinicellaceae]|uniref:DUF937 domain-containing protein n=1 Tax=Sphingosinicellaceae TaxID=2820280 RepID=UPI001C1E7E10|nr:MULTISPECIES: DUF937 domain-containing protein [Polymorphobacter]QYE36042.1 DUF937 domain-containing protein [Polymorphobacter sp. PAMC 29334]UAJ10386.1 DUF937 domain-containing protein [Polymorphobacter megasporae]
MSQQLLDLINRFGGEDAIAAMAARVGLSPEQTQSAMAALMPAVAGGMAKQVEAQGPGALDAAAAPATALASGGTVASDAAVEHGTNILGSLFGSSQVTDVVTGNAAAATGLDASKLSALLPMIATLAAGALGHAGGQAPAEGGGLGGMLGGLLGQVTGGTTAGTAPATGAAGTLMSMLDFNKDGNVMDDIMGVVGKLRGH